MVWGGEGGGRTGGGGGGGEGGGRGEGLRLLRAGEGNAIK